jgi:hypothetical protein
MRKLNLLFKSFLLLCALIAGSTAWADEYNYNFSSGGTYNETANPKTSTWVTELFTILQEKNTSTTDVANYLTAPRWYKNHNVTITPAASVTITKIVINCSGSNNGQDITASTGSVAKNGNNSTWTGSITSSSPLVLTMGAQCRPSSIDVTYTSTEAKCATPTFTPEAGVYNSAQNVSIACETAGATIYYTTDGTAPTTSSSVYSSAIPVSTTTTIKAMAAKAGNSNSVVATATYAILAHAGTEADPYTVADARAAIDANAGITDVYATGIVSEIVTAYSEQHKNITFNISTDGETTSDQLQAYRCAGIESVTDASKVQVGDIVVIKGNLTKYNSTYEFAQGNQLISLQHSQKATPTSVWKSGGNAVESIIITKGGSISATFETNSTGTKSFESSNTEVATVSNTGVISLTGKAGIAVITASTASNNTYLSSEAKLLIVIGEPVEDAVLNFGNYQDYGSGIVPGDAYYAEASTWTAGNISLTVSGKYRWFIDSKNATDLRLYTQKENDVETTKFTITAPSGKKLTKIVITGSSHGSLTADGYSAGTWTGLADNVTFTYGASSGSINISTITVYYSGPTISVTMGQEGWMTYYNVGAALSFEGVTAYRVSSVAEDHVNLLPVTEAPANTPVLLKAEPGAYNFTVIASAESVGTNKLRRSDGTITSDENNDVYALAKKNSVVGFYKVQAGVTVPAGKCYLSVAKSTEPSSARDFLGFIEENATRINAVENGQSTDEVFDLQGRQVKQPTKGLYIKNGKKVIIK